MKPSDVLACSLPEWYPNFSKISIKSVILPLPGSVLGYLQGMDSVVLPQECDSEWGTNERDEDDDDDSPTEFDDEGEEEARPTFPEFSRVVKATIKRLGGDVFCKLNWSAPRDAIWVSLGNSLRCSNLSEVYLLLKSSEFVRHDLTQPFKDCEVVHGERLPSIQYQLVLKRWTEINPSHEYRCFVKGNVLIGISQRDGTHCYRHIDAERDSIIKDISSFFDEYICQKFPLEDYVFDLVRVAKDVVQLIDFNPFGYTTDPILFEWDELFSNSLMRKSGEPILFRFVETDAGIQPNGLRQYSLPRDVIDLAAGTDPEKLVDFLKLQQKT